MKRTLSLLLVLLLALAATAPAALADVIWEPVGDSFYTSHQEDFSYFGRSLYFNAQDGVTDLYKSPDGEVIGSVPNGGTARAEFSWQEWYLIYDPTTEDAMDMCYIRASDAVPVYDSDAFMAEYSGRITTTDSPRYPTMPEDGEAPVCLYSYPGSGAVYTTMGPDGLPGCSLLFTDEDGLTWGYVNYWYGVRNVWLCLDDPCDDALPYKGRDTAVLARLIPAADPEKAQQAQAEPTQQEPAQTADGPENVSETQIAAERESSGSGERDGGLSPLVLVGIIVAVVVVATVFILILVQPNKKAPRQASKTEKENKP